MRVYIMIVVLFFQLILLPNFTLAADYTNSLLFKATIENNGDETEFEYENPAHYEWEVGTNVTKGEKAKEKVEDLYNVLEVSSKPTVDNIRGRLEQYGFTSLDRFVVKWIDPDGNLYTWHWDKSEILSE